jgi:hypothetical protein
MDETVQSFLQIIRERSHVLQLLKHTELLIILISGGKRIQIAIKDGDIYLEHDPDETVPTYEINGEIKQLLEGKETLRYLVQKGKLKISAPFRTILLLESIFYLTKAS